MPHASGFPTGLTSLLLKPYYYRRPRQIVRAARARLRALPAEVQSAPLAIGVEIVCRPREMIGATLLRTGVFELATTELILRLADPGDRCLDVGANIGYMTAVFAKAAGPSGTVSSWEPHPHIGELLAINAKNWNNDGEMAQIHVHRAAVSNGAGVAKLGEGHSFAGNNGSAALGGSGSSFVVPTDSLDDVLGDNSVGILKIDVEGHEREVVEGAQRLLRSGLIRDVIFEEHAQPPTPVTDALAACGYTVLRFWQGRFGMSLGPMTGQPDVPSWDAANYLATLEPERARTRLAGRGWRTLAARR